MTSKEEYKTAVLMPAYNEGEYITQAIKQWVGLVDKVLVLVPVKPWKGKPQEDDGTIDKAIEAGAEVIVHDWKSEDEQRNWGLARLYDYRVIMADADEFYSLEDRKTIVEFSKGDELCGRPETIITYWKYNYVLSPQDVHRPVIYYNPKLVKVNFHRDPMLVKERKLLDYQPIIPVTLHHFSWSKPDHKIKAKIENVDYGPEIKKGWYENVWLPWEESMEDIKPVGHESCRAVPCKPPLEIQNIIANNTLI